MYIVTDKGSQYLDKYYDKFDTKQSYPVPLKVRILSDVKVGDQDLLGAESTWTPKRYEKSLTSLVKQGYLEEIEDPLPGEEIGSYGYEERTGNYADSLAIELGKR